MSSGTLNTSAPISPRCAYSTTTNAPVRPRKTLVGAYHADSRRTTARLDPTANAPTAMVLHKTRRARRDGAGLTAGCLMDDTRTGALSSGWATELRVRLARYRALSALLSRVVPSTPSSGHAATPML